MEATSELLNACVCRWGRSWQCCAMPSLQYFFSEEEGVWHYNHRLQTRLARKRE